MPDRLKQPKRKMIDPTRVVPAKPSKVDVIACPHPFSLERVQRVVVEGRTIAEIVADMGIPAEHAWVLLDGHPVPHAWWGKVKPKAGHRLFIRAVPRGGGGGDKNVLGIVLMIAVVVVAAVVTGGALAPALGPAFAAGSTGAILAGAAVTIAGGLLVNALVPAPVSAP